MTELSMTSQITRGIERNANGLMWFEAESLQHQDGLRHGF